MAKIPVTPEIDSNIAQVGDVVHSLLDEATFQALRSSSWVLMDGRSVVGSTYETLTGNSTVPDARGQSLRAKNNGRNDGNEDTSGERALGSFQTEQVGPIAGLEQGNISQYSTGGNQAGVFYWNGAVQNPYTWNPAGENRIKNIAVNIFIKID